MSGQLERLLEQATPPLRIGGIPPGIISENDLDVTDEVLETWHDLARLLVDIFNDDGTTLRPSLLARYLEIEQRAGEGQA